MDAINVVVKHIGRLLCHPYSTVVSRVVLGGILIFAGVTKLPHISTLIWEIDQYHILPRDLAIAFGYAIPSLELYLGTLLVLGILLRINASISGLLLLSFTIAKITAIARGLDIDVCSCFGPTVPLLTAHSLAINFALLSLVLQLLLHKGEFLSLGAWLSAKTRTIER